VPPNNITQHPLKSASPSVLWPALTGKSEAPLAAILFQLEQTQWWPPEALREQQFRQLKPLLEHAWQTIPFYRDRLSGAGYQPGQAITEEFWTALPLLTRSDIQLEPDALLSSDIPKTHGAVHSTTTSGSTGRPLKVYGTRLTSLMWMAFALREHHWHQRDISGKLAVIRYLPPGSRLGSPPDGTTGKNWGAPASILYQTGPSATLSISADISVQAAWLEKQRPDYLLTYPSNLDAILRYCREHRVQIENLREIRTISEIVTPALRSLCEETLGVPIVDVYSANDLGYIAVQCPDCHQYHIQSESLLCEVLDDAGKPCRPGETGRVVGTGLHNYAMPLLRYEIGDYAVIGESRLCRRGLLAISSILGRSRNMLTMPDGQKRWPRFLAWREIAPIAQWQILQETREHLKARIVPLRALTAEDEERLTQSIAEDYGFRFDIQFEYLNEIRGHENGKFEEFISQVG